MSSSLAWLIAVIVAGLVTIVLGCTWLTNFHVEKMAELGYQEECVAGYGCPVWRAVR